MAEHLRHAWRAVRPYLVPEDIDPTARYAIERQTPWTCQSASGGAASSTTYAAEQRSWGPQTHHQAWHDHS